MIFNVKRQRHDCVLTPLLIVFMYFSHALSLYLPMPISLIINSKSFHFWFISWLISQSDTFSSSFVWYCKVWYSSILFQLFSLSARCELCGWCRHFNRDCYAYLVLHGLDIRITCPPRRFVGDIAHQTGLAMVLHSRCNS